MGAATSHPERPAAIASTVLGQKSRASSVRQAAHCPGRGRGRLSPDQGWPSWTCEEQKLDDATADRSYAALTSNEGFSVVAPIRTMVPCSTFGNRCILLGFVKAVDFIENSTVLPPCDARSQASRNGGANFFDTGSDGGQC